MARTPLVKIPYPSENQKDFWPIFEQMLNTIDSFFYALREDRNLFFREGGTFSLDVSNNLTWTSDLTIQSPLSGFRVSYAAGTLVITDGQVLYVRVPRTLTSNATSVLAVAATLPYNTSPEEIFVLGLS